MLDSAHSAHYIATLTGFHTSTSSRLGAKERSELQESTGGQNAVQITKTLPNIINQPLHHNTVCQALKKTGLKAVHHKAQLDYAYAHKDCTVEDWKKGTSDFTLEDFSFIRHSEPCISHPGLLHSRPGLWYFYLGYLLTYVIFL
ncbi:hypothetical protein BS17DRAFT_776939 [Gyrodon lividus]|nr:hypothetical protein BS17DRAFT_776939 [Gyrodon lividus]